MARGRILRQVHRARAAALLSCVLLAIAPSALAKNWNNDQYVDPGVQPTNVRFAIENKQYKLTEQKNRNGKVIRQTLIGEGFIQNTIDRDGDGHLDSWELRRPNSLITMSAPFKGRFSRMDVEKQYPQGILRMEFYRNSKGAFQLVSSNASPYSKMRKADDADQFLSVGCRMSEVRLQGRSIDTMAALVEPDTDADLRKALADQAMTPSCKQGEFANNRSKIIDGIMSVVKSDSKESIGADSKKGAVKGTFLQCLRYYDLDTHATRITSAFSNYINSIPNDQFKWKISCDANSKDAGGFEQKFAPVPPVIVLGPASHQNASGGDLTSAYAATFFHEMLHYSLIADEATTTAIEKCCSQKDGESGPACKQVESTVRIQKRARVFENIFEKQFGDKYVQYMDSLKKQFGKKMDVDKELHRFFTEAAKHYEKIKADCGVQDGIELTGDCKARFDKELKQVINDEFGENGNGRCEKAAADQSTAQAYCETLKQITFEKFQISLGGLDGKNYCINRKASLLNWLVANVYADGEDSLTTVCGFKAPASSDPIHYDETRSDMPDLRFIVSSDPTTPTVTKILPIPFPNDGGTIVVPPGEKVMDLAPYPQKDKSIDDAANNATPDPKGSKHNFGPPTPNADQGPNGTLYSNSPTEREGQVLNSLKRQAETESHVTQIADNLAKQAFQPAQARDSEQPKSPKTQDDVKLLSYDRPQQAMALSTEPLVRFPSVSDPLPPSRSIASVDTSYTAPVSSALNNPVGGAAHAVASSVGASQNPGGGVAPEYKPVYQYRYGGGHKFFPVAGLAGPNAASPDGTEKKPLNLSKAEAEAREKKSLIVFLQGPYSTVRPELDNARFVDELARYSIQVIDDAGKAYGSGAPSAKLAYDERVSRLVIISSRVSKADQ